MQLSIVIVLALGCHHAGADLSKEESSPLPKVVKLLQRLKDQLVKDGEQEEKDFKTYAAWCRKGGRKLKYEIKSEKSEIEDDKAVISKAGSDKSSASLKIEGEASSISETENSLKLAEGVRAKERKEFQGNERELTESIDTLERATNVLQRKMRGAALTQMKVNRNDIRSLVSTLDAVVNAAGLALHDQKKLMSLVQSADADEDDLSLSDFGAPKAAAYKSHGSSILDLLEDLKQKAESQLTQLRSEEQNAQHNFEMLAASLRDQIKLAKKEMNGAKKSKIKAAQLTASSKGDLAVIAKLLGVDQKNFGNLRVGCSTVAQEYDASVKSRADELGAIDAALEALKNVKVSASSLVQIQGSQDKFEVVNILRKLAQQQRSTALTQLAGRVSTAMTIGLRSNAGDPFKKVKNLIAGMVARLEKEAKSEASHKDYCDKEIKESKAKQEELSDGLEIATAKIDKVKAKAAGLKDTVSALQKDLVSLRKMQGEADQMRNKQHSTYVKAKSDLKQGMEGVRMALKMLRRYYEKKEALLQRPTLAAAHSSHKGTGDSVISILDLIEHDMSKELQTLEAEEAQAAHAYKELTSDNTEARITKEHSVQYKIKESTSLQRTLGEYGSDRDSAQSEMDAVLEYAKNLKRMCSSKTEETYAQRSSRREAEVAGLKEALKVLSGEAFMQIGAEPRLRGIAKH